MVAIVVDGGYLFFFNVHVLLSLNKCYNSKYVGSFCPLRLTPKTAGRSQWKAATRAEAQGEHASAILWSYE